MHVLGSLLPIGYLCFNVIAYQIPLFSNEGLWTPTSDKLFDTSSSDAVVALHKQLIEIESITGNEKDVGEWLASYLESNGLTVEKQEVAKNRYNIFAYPGKERRTKVLVTSHIDTVWEKNFIPSFSCAHC